MSYPRAVLVYEMSTEQFAPAAKTAENALEQIKGKAKDTDKEIAKLEQTVSSTQKKVAASFTGMVANVGSLAFAFRDLGDSKVQIDTLELKMQKLRIAMSNTKLSADQLAIKNEELRLLGERHADAVENQQKAYYQFGLSMVTMATTTIPATIAAITQMRAAQTALATAQIAATGTTVIQTTANAGLAAAHGTTTTATNMHTAANLGLAASFRALTAAMISNPLGLALIAVSIGGLALYSTNLGGIKDKVDGLIGSFGGATTASQQYHTEMQSGTTVLQNYSAELDGVAAAVQGVLDVQQKEIFKRALTKDSTLIGSVDQYLQLDRILNTATSEMQTMLKYEKDVDRVLEKIVAKHSDELDALGATNQFLERRLQLHLRIEESQERISKRERDESKKKRDDENLNIFDRERAAIQLKRELELLESIPMSLRPVYSLFEAMKLLDPRDLAGGRQIQKMIERIDALQNARFSQIMVSAFPQSGPLGKSLGNFLPASSERLGDFGAGVLQKFSTSNQGGRSGSGKARRGGFGGNKPGFGLQEVEKPFLASISKLQSTINNLALYGFNIAAPSFDLSSRIAGYRSPSPEFMQESIRQSTAKYNEQMAEYNRQVAAAKAKIASDAAMAGLDAGTYMSMYITSQGREDISGFTLAKQLASLA